MRKGSSNISPGHSHQYSIADRDAVQELLKKINDAGGCKSVDEGKLCEAIETAASQYEGAKEEVRQAFFHGLLTGYSVAIQTQRTTDMGSKTAKGTAAGAGQQARSKSAGR